MYVLIFRMPKASRTLDIVVMLPSSRSSTPWPGMESMSRRLSSGSVASYVCHSGNSIQETVILSDTFNARKFDAGRIPRTGHADWVMIRKKYGQRISSVDTDRNREGEADPKIGKENKGWVWKKGLRQERFSKHKWCRRRDLNPHGFPHTPLKRACLPFHHFGTDRDLEGKSMT